MTNAIEAAAKPAGGLYFKTPVTPEEAFQAIGRLRRDARDEIDRLICFLDATDNHMEREPDDEGDDAELEEGDPGEDDGTREPSLGSVERHPSLYCEGRNPTGDQRRWAAGGALDLEAEHDGCEPGEDDEPDASGIGDQDGLDEQVPFQDWQHVGMV